METESAPTTDGESDTASTSEISSGTESGVTTETSMDTDDVFSTRASRETESGLTSEVTQGTRAAMTTQSSSLSSQRSTVRVTGDTSQALTTEPSSETDSGLTSETTGATEAGLTTSAFGTSNTEARVTSASPGGTQFRTPTDVSVATLLISITEEPSDTRTSSTTTASSTSNPTSFESTQSTNAATTGLSQTSSTAEPTTNEAIATTAGVITEQNLCNGQCDEERQDCVNGECVCKEGFEIPYEESVCEPITFYSIVLAITELNGGSAIFTSELSNVASTAFISLQLTVCTGLSRALDNFFLGFKSCSVISFVDGSIIATVRVGFANTTGLDRDGIDAALDLVENGFFGLTETNFTIDPSLTEVNPTDECALELDNCSPRANCMDRAENGFTCQCWDGYIDRSEAQYPGRDCATFSWKVVTITVSVIVGTMLLVAIILIACGQRIALACAKSRDRAAVKPNQGGGRPNGKQDKSVSTVEDTIPWHDQGDDHQVFYGRTADGQEAGKEFDSYDLEIYRSIPNAEERYTQVP
ncbi:uncharacterized protein [Diadema antillarum]|uniref:uncharacterized protein n=1 Tax=Diadema antillarum TaxID=105358 RepID=UPI003A87451C